MLNINLRQSNEERMFAGEADMTDVDVAASIDRFDEMVYEAVCEAYPDAIVSDRAINPDAFGMATVWYDDKDEIEERTWDEDAVALRIGNLADRIHEGGEWIVTG